MGVWTSSGAPSIARFAAPCTGECSVTATFTALQDDRNTAAKASVTMLGGGTLTPTLAPTVVNDGFPISYTGTFTAVAGDSIDFVVSDGTKSTQVDAK
jgi:hypothetical protein